MFGTKHLIILAVCAAYIAGMLFILIRKKPSLNIVLKVLLTVGIFSETMKVCSYIVANEEKFGGYLPKTDLPFHLCSMQIILMIILVLSKNSGLKRLLYSFMLPTCLIGGFAALLLPTSSSLNMPVITVQYFLYHSSIFVYAVYLYITDEIRFDIGDYFHTCIMMFGLFFFAIYLNSWVNDYSGNINFMYVVKPPMDGLPYLNKNRGWLVYMIRYALLALFCLTACYIKPIVSSMKKHPAAKSGNGGKE